MKSFAKKLLAACVAAGLPVLAQATSVRVQVTGVVDYNVIGGSMSGVQSGDPAVMSFKLDSTDFVDSPSYPTRGYVIDLPSFAMTVGGRPVTMDIPQPIGSAYFVLRNNDPAVDGFFISLDSVENYFPLAVHIPGLTPEHELDFHVTYDSPTTLSSLNILDAVGSYGTAGMSVYQWTIGRFGNPGAEYVFDNLSISAVPEPATTALFMAGLGLIWIGKRQKVGLSGRRE